MRKVTVQLLALAVCLLAGPLAYAQTVDEVINKNIEATGGLAKWKEVKTMRMEGKFVLPSMGIELPMSSYAKAPRMVRQEIDFQGSKVTPFTYDGTTPWKLMPPEAGGSGSPEKMSEDEAKDFVDDADIENHFIDYASKGHQAELMGKEAVEGTECYKVKFTKKSGRVQYYFFEVETFALIMMRSTQKNAMFGELEMDTFMSDYKEVNGLMVPYSADVKSKGNSIQKLVWEKVVINEEIDEKVFMMPNK
jgi:hypothetical protein